MDKLRRERWDLYTDLLPVYFGDDPNPTLLDRWYEELPDSPAARPALDNHDEAVTFMHAHVERGLSRHGLKRLKVDAPWWTQGAKPRSIAPGPASALEAYYENLETNDAPTAVRKAAEESGYDMELVWELVRLTERVLTSLPRHHRLTANNFLAVDGFRLRKLRHECLLSQAGLERRSGVGKKTIGGLEGGKRDARPPTVRKLAEALGVDPHYLMKGGDDAR